MRIFPLKQKIIKIMINFFRYFVSVRNIILILSRFPPVPQHNVVYLIHNVFSSYFHFPPSPSTMLRWGTGGLCFFTISTLFWGAGGIFWGYFVVKNVKKMKFCVPANLMSGPKFRLFGQPVFWKLPLFFN